MHSGTKYWGWSHRSFLLTIVIISLLMGQALYSQTATGNIIGRITDSTGAVISGAAVTALNPDKGLTFRTVTDSEGIYRFFYLAPAVYTLSVQHAGLSSVERPGVQLQSY